MSIFVDAWRACPPGMRLPLGLALGALFPGLPLLFIAGWVDPYRLARHSAAVERRREAVGGGRR